MMLIFYLFILLIGLITGSFISALSYRIPRGLNVALGRSACDKCKAKISWNDNVPLLSFLLLKGKCRSCGKPISIRYPLTELSTALVFVVLAGLVNSCIRGAPSNLSATSLVCQLAVSSGWWLIPLLLVLSTLLIAMFVTDIEHKIIPDELVFISLTLTFFYLIAISYPFIFTNLLTGFGASLVFLILHLVTKGKGMGLGDVKLALFFGLFFGWPNTLTWFYTSILSGAFVGIILVLLKKAQFGRQIPFGPFMIISFFLTLIWGDNIFKFMFFYL